MKNKIFNQKKISCPLCLSRNTRYAYLSTIDKIKYHTCNKCGLYFQSKIHYLSNKKINSFYSKEYFTKGYSNLSKDYKKRRLQYKNDKKYINKFFPDARSKNILDFGCGNGEFVKLFKGKKFGFEFNSDAKVNSSINRINLKEIQKYKYDLIIMRGVIEHLKNFKDVTKKLVKCLKKNGQFVIMATPNTHSYAFVKNKKAFNQNNERHLFHFNPVNLTEFFLKLGLFNIDLSYPYHDTPYKNFIRDFKKIKKIKFIKISPPGVGNMMSLVFKKIGN